MRSQADRPGSGGLERLIFRGGEIAFGTDQDAQAGGRTPVLALELFQDLTRPGRGIHQGGDEKKLGRGVPLNPCRGRGREFDRHPPGIPGLLRRFVGNSLPSESLGLRIVRATDTAFRQQGNDPGAAQFHRSMQQSFHRRALGNGLKKDQLARPRRMLDPALDAHADGGTAGREDPSVKLSAGAVQEDNRFAGLDPQDPDGMMSLAFGEDGLGDVGTEARNEKPVHAMLARS